MEVCIMLISYICNLVCKHNTVKLSVIATYCFPIIFNITDMLFRFCLSVGYIHEFRWGIYPKGQGLVSLKTSLKREKTPACVINKNHLPHNQSLYGLSYPGTTY